MPDLNDPALSELSALEEYFRRSGRNLAQGASEAIDWLAQGAKAGAEPTIALMRGDDIDQPLFPTAESGGKSRLGAVASALDPNLIPAATPAGALGIYGGRAAKTANLAKQGQAERAIGRGMDPEHIRKTTGWFQDQTGDWKFEISDHKASLYQDKDGTWKFRHRELERAYPELKDMRVETIPEYTPLGEVENTLGDYSPSLNRARINERVLRDDPKKALKVLLHELQHAVQDREGFSPGTAQASDEIGQLVNTEYWPRYDQIENDMALVRRERENWLNTHPGSSLEDYYKAVPDWPDRHDALLNARNTYPGVNDWTFKKYMAALGEMEARDAMYRSDMTPDQRRQFPPYATALNHDKIAPGDVWDVRKVLDQMKPGSAELRTFLRRHIVGGS